MKTDTRTFQGVTGEALHAVLARAFSDYTTATTEDMPTISDCEGWVLARSNNYGPHASRWSLCELQAAKEAPRGCPALASSCYEWWAVRNGHPSLVALRRIVAVMSTD